MKKIQYTTFSALTGLSHAIFKRTGGVSCAPYASLNLGDNVEDDPVCVEENTRRALAMLDAPRCAKLVQVHGIEIVEPGVLEGDGLITEEKGVALMIRHADCQAAIFYAPEEPKLCVVHAGWKGLVGGIYKAAVQAMKRDPSSLIVCIGPSLGPNHAEYRTFPRGFEAFEHKKNYYNFWDLAEKQLSDLGVKEIYIERLCTFEHPEDYFSYRRDGVTGRNATIAML